ncbi:hypothetical protein [Neopusillimonas aromaticivorans]|uniref:hypothetical protein n=1 Tax=Neopusillimonas aromaticivorans TaxID=2979868 RepID=UPI0025918FBB|nr:hypothetical protein [Neopusillimonas aromaticivorans]WJJ93044.1 hypothetical protein N7E01_13075 [Neopusillimonas aromaticivorans]
MLQGDFGTSISFKQPVSLLVLERLPATLELSILALLIALAIGGFTAVLGAKERGRTPEAAVDLFNGATLSIPDFCGVCC